MKLGRRQRCLLHDMRLYGGNHWEVGNNGQARRFNEADRKMLEALHARGLVTGATRYAALTQLGRDVADLIITEVWGHRPIVVRDTIVLVIPRGATYWHARCGQHGVIECDHRHLTPGSALACAHDHVADHLTGTVDHAWPGQTAS